MSVKICIPSYNRFDIKTFSVLGKFNNKDIYVFINNYSKEELEEKDITKKYILNSPMAFGDINWITIDTKGISAARNGILDYFPKGEKIIMLDDDVEGVYRLGVNKSTLKKELNKMTDDEFVEFVDYAFNLLEKNKMKLWGMYPIHNAFYMDNKINKTGFCIGTMMGIINSDLRFDPELALKEDYDFTIKNILKYKKVARFNYITLKATHYGNPGGCCQQRKEDPDKERKCCDRLLAKYPGIVKRNPKRENEVLIKI